jgi:hypothetical protein
MDGTIKGLLESPQTLGTVIHAILRKKYGDEAYVWDLASVCMQVKDDFGADMCSEAVNRFGAIQVVMTNDAFFNRPDAFIAICNTLTTGEPFFDMFSPATTEEVAWGVSEVSLNRDLLPFSDDVLNYIQLVSNADGYEGGYPRAIEAYLKGPEEAGKHVREIRNNPNNDVVDMYINEQLKDMVYQFNKADGFTTIDDIILNKNRTDTVSEIIDG